MRGVAPAESAPLERAVIDWGRYAAVIIVEPNRRVWQQARSGAEAVAKLDERLSAALNSTMNLIYVQGAVAADSEPLFFELWNLAGAHARGWELPEPEALLNLRRWLDGLSVEKAQDRTRPIALVGAVREDEVVQAAEAVVRAGWPAVIVETACLSARHFRNLEGERRKRRAGAVQRLVIPPAAGQRLRAGYSPQSRPDKLANPSEKRAKDKTC